MKPTPTTSQTIDQAFGICKRTELSAQVNASVAVEKAKTEEEFIGQNSSSSLSAETPCQKREAATTTPNNVIENSSDDDFSFEGFDFSDEDLDQYVETPSSLTSSRYAVSARTVSSTPASHSSRQDKSQSIQHHAKSTAPPCPPFMHPSLFDHGFDFDIEGQAERTFTCFRAGELLQLIKRLQSFGSSTISDVSVELFATVREVRFVDSTGQGQGVVFADIFFPEQPPYITTTSKTPYSVQDLLPKSQGSDAPQGLMRAVIACHPPSTRTRRTPIASSGSRNDFNVPSSARTTNLEVQEVRHTSWEEVLEVRSMIASDLRAKGAKGQAATRVHDRTNANVETSALDLDDSLIDELTTMVDLSDADHRSNIQ